MLKIAHIINPVKVSESSDLYIAQPITFETMRKAKEFAKNEVEVQLFTAQYKEDKEIIPNFFIQTADLEKSVLEYGTFEKQRKLPLIKDILDRLYEEAIEADYFIYSNVDIALQPHFYTSVKRFIEKGYDAFVINRRTIPKEYNSIELLSQMYQQKGESHPGYDCFVFKRSIYKKIVLESIVIGARYVGKVLVENLQQTAQHFNIFQDEYLTFHIGNDRVWDEKSNNEFNEHNQKQYQKCMQQIKTDINFNISTNYKSLIEEIKKKRLIFTITTGRSGTGLLSDLINNNTKIKSFHEPEPDFQKVFIEAKEDNNVARMFLLNEKLPFIAENKSDIYIETSHLFCKGFLDELLNLGIYPELIILRRSEREVAKSMYQLNTIPGRTEKGIKFYISPEDKNIHFRISNFKNFNDYQMCFWYTLEIRKRQEFYKNYYQMINKTTYYLDFNYLNDEKYLKSFFKDLQLSTNFIIKKSNKINEKSEKKTPFNLTDYDLIKYEKEVLMAGYSNFIL